MNDLIWITHTGSSPGCQYTPSDIVDEWFNGEDFDIDLAEDCLRQCIEYYDDRNEPDEEHERCFNQQRYEIDIEDMRNIIRDLKEEEDRRKQEETELES